MTQIPTKVIRVTLETYDGLQMIKKDRRLGSFDEVIRLLAKRAL